MLIQALPCYKPQIIISDRRLRVLLPRVCRLRRDSFNRRTLLHGLIVWRWRWPYCEGHCTPPIPHQGTKRERWFDITLKTRQWKDKILYNVMFKTVRNGNQTYAIGKRWNTTRGRWKCYQLKNAIYHSDLLVM